MTWARVSSARPTVMAAPLSTAATKESSAFNLSPAASRVGRSGTNVLQPTLPTSGEYTCMKRFTCRPVIWLTFSVTQSPVHLLARVARSETNLSTEQVHRCPYLPRNPQPFCETVPVRGRGSGNGLTAQAVREPSSAQGSVGQGAAGEPPHRVRLVLEDAGANSRVVLHHAGDLVS